MGEIDEGPGDARGAAEDGEDEEPREEEDEDVCGPHPWIHEPLRVPVQIRRWHRRHIQLSHQDNSTASDSDSDSTDSPFNSLSLSLSVLCLMM